MEIMTERITFHCDRLAGELRDFASGTGRSLENLYCFSPTFRYGGRTRHPFGVNICEVKGIL